MRKPKIARGLAVIQIVHVLFVHAEPVHAKPVRVILVPVEEQVAN